MIAHTLLRRDGRDDLHRTLLHLLPYIVLPTIGTVIGSYVVGSPLFADRVLVCAIAPYCLLISLALSELPTRWLRIGGYCALVLWAGVSLRRSVDQQAESAARWDEIATCVSNRGGAVLPVRAAEDWITTPYILHLGISGARVPDVQSVRSFHEPLPQRFWAAYRPVVSGNSIGRRYTQQLKEAGYHTTATCETGDPNSDLHVRFDRMDLTKPALLPAKYHSAPK